MNAPTLDDPSVVLIGAPGSGKSTVGNLLAGRLGFPFTDIDQLIEAQEGTTIGDIFVTRGEPAFRALETSVTLTALERQGVTALGGGAINSERIREALRGHIVIWLECTVATAADRVGLNTARPLLLGNVRGRLVKLLNERTPLYREAATISVVTDGRTPDEIAAELVERIDALPGAVAR